MADEDQDKSEEATPYKLREAQRRGQVAKSLDFNSFLMTLCLLAVLVIWAKSMIVSALQANTSLLSHAHQLDFGINSLSVWLTAFLRDGFAILAPLLIAVVIVAVLMNILQTGPIFSFFPIKPDFNRLNPVTGFKRVFSKKMLFEAFKSVIKIALFATVIYLVIDSILPRLANLYDVDPDGYASSLLGFAIKMVLSLAIAMLVVALLDILYTRMDFRKKMMMSRRDLKDEVKRREGDPHVRKRIKEVQREAAKRTQSIQRVPDADVLITNPTHYAIAIKYDRTRHQSPVVLAKGAGSLAQRMKYMAAKHHVPIIEKKSLAQYLFRETEIDASIPEDAFRDVARILVWAYRQTGKLPGKPVVS
jgi:flagellar biosynthetic protein FlhB